VTVVSEDAVHTPKPSLESLLASCGALQSALRHDSVSVETPRCESVEDTSYSANGSLAVDVEEEVQTPEPEFSATSDDTESDEATSNETPLIEISSETTGWLELLRQEFRTSVNELKSAQSAAAEAQSAVLKTLTEIIFQSSAMRDNSGDGIEQKLVEFEDRIVNRIGQSGGIAVAARESGDFSSDSTSIAEPSKKNLARTWTEIRNELVSRGETGGEGLEYGLSESTGGTASSEVDETTSLDDDCIDEVPKTVDPELLNDQELRAVFHEREEFIVKLIGRLRHQHQKSSGHVPAEQLKHMAEFLPKDLAEQVLKTLQQLNELARIGELELSLERARLSRQVNQLDTSRQLIEHNARQIGLTLEEDGTLSNPLKLTLRTAGSRRWLSKLGFGQ